MSEKSKRKGPGRPKGTDRVVITRRIPKYLLKRLKEEAKNRGTTETEILVGLLGSLPKTLQERSGE